MRLRYCGMFNYCLARHLLLWLPVKCFENRLAFGKVRGKSIFTFVCTDRQGQHVKRLADYSLKQLCCRQFSRSTLSPGHGEDDIHWRVLRLCLTSHCCVQLDQSDQDVHLHAKLLSSTVTTSTPSNYGEG